jgi:hypothetical protein
VDEHVTYWHKQELWTKDGLHYRLKGFPAGIEYKPYYDDLYWQDIYNPTRIRTYQSVKYTWRITEGPMAHVVGVGNERGMFSTHSIQEAIDAGFFELVAPIKH